MSWWRRLFGKREEPAAPSPPEEAEAPDTPEVPDDLVASLLQPTEESPAVERDREPRDADLVAAAERVAEAAPAEAAERVAEAAPAEAAAEPPEPEPVAEAEPPAPPPLTEPQPTGEIEVRRLAPEEAQAVLERVLDDLGAAHHRPFSRG